jgi:hypothetical protein
MQVKTGASLAGEHVVSCDPAQASHSCVLEVGVVSC